MIKAFEVREGYLVSVPVQDAPHDLQHTLWLDLLAPSDEERALVESLPGMLPTAEEAREIEASSRFFKDEGGLHIHTFFLVESSERLFNTTVAFTLGRDRLLSLREQEVPVFRLLRQRIARRAVAALDAATVLITLLELQLDSVADRLQDIHGGLENTALFMQSRTSAKLDEAIETLTQFEDANGKARLCLMDMQRGCTFLLRCGNLAASEAERVRELQRDIDSLLPHSTFLFEKVNFLMDAAQGFINIQQNQIIKIFSVLAVIFLPPTLVASSYGMNFEHMPELSWPLGYPMAIGLMITAAVVPYWYFRRKGWL
ncbi:MAG: magnesium/cobalt transporter CorA [Pseudomonadota bacterium]|nr:magnesium/cobalt transporter CorA [Pseudomonadota bacterium]